MPIPRTFDRHQRYNTRHTQVCHIREHNDQSFYSELVGHPVVVFMVCCIHRVAQNQHYRSVANWVVRLLLHSVVLYVCIVGMGLSIHLSIHRVVVFGYVVLYKTWMLLWKWVIVFVGLLYSMDHYTPEFMVVNIVMIIKAIHFNTVSWCLKSVLMCYTLK